MIDASHAQQPQETRRTSHGDRATSPRQIESGERRIIGVMIESHLVGGRQDLVPGKALAYGQSITDGCIDWETSVALLEHLSRAVELRRQGGPRLAAGEAAVAAC